MSSANSHTLALLLVLILTVVFSITSLALLLYRRHRRHRAVAHSQARDAHVGTADLEAKLLCSPADTLSPSLDQERPPEDTGAILDDLEAADADKDATDGLRTFEEFVHPQSARPTQVDIAARTVRRGPWPLSLSSLPSLQKHWGDAYPQQQQLYILSGERSTGPFGRV
ncbi:hypothetical protein C8Q80DRAFT_1275678 [Daedaleopsis nitida]|nr:hypothetical protein C8Q80DRAFT_1275678 [Daedaleopsis nitida]